MTYGTLPVGYGNGTTLWGAFGVGYGAFGASEKRCAKIERKIERKKSKLKQTRRRRKKRKLKRRIEKLQSRYMRKGCTDIVGVDILSTDVDHLTAMSSARSQADAEASDEFELMQAAVAPTGSAGGVDNSKVWLIGGAAVLGLLAVVAMSSRKGASAAPPARNPRRRRRRRNQRRAA